MTDQKKPEDKDGAVAPAAVPAAATDEVLHDPDTFDTSGNTGAVASNVITDPDAFETGTEGARLGAVEVPPDDVIADPDDFQVAGVSAESPTVEGAIDPDSFETRTEVAVRPAAEGLVEPEGSAGGVIADPDEFATEVDDLTGMDNVIEALLLASETPLSLESLLRLIGEDFNAGKAELRASLKRLSERYVFTAMQLHEVAGGWRIQVQQDYAHWVARLYHEKPPKLSRATLETLALIVYRQPITRGEIESVRGVAVSSNILRTLLERGWIREVGHKEAPGRPALFGTTPQFLDDFSLRSLDQLPTLPEIKDVDQLEAALARLAPQMAGAAEAEEGDEGEAVSELAGAEAGDDGAPQDATVH